MPAYCKAVSRSFNDARGCVTDQHRPNNLHLRALRFEQEIPWALRDSAFLHPLLGHVDVLLASYSTEQWGVAMSCQSA